MKVKLQATGHLPIEFDAHLQMTSTQMLAGDKRGVRITIYEAQVMHDNWVAHVEYLSTWGNERPVSQVPRAMSLERLAESVRESAPFVLPPGAGFPATPEYATRQSKLVGMIQTLTLVALSEVLAGIQEIRNASGT